MQFQCDIIIVLPANNINNIPFLYGAFISTDVFTRFTDIQCVPEERKPRIINVLS